MLARRIFRYYFTERQWLMVLNGFIMVFSVAQSGMAQAFINVVFRDSVFQERDQEDELLITWLGMAALGVYTGLSAFSLHPSSCSSSPALTVDASSTKTSH